MIETVFQHLRETENVGDRACSPGLWRDFGEASFAHLGAEVPPCRRAIFGGGQVFRQAAEAALRARAARRRVLWGVGISGAQAAGLLFDLLAEHTLISSRNWGVPGCDYVPCASLLSPLFDAPPAPQTEVVCFWHATKSGPIITPEAFPARRNHGGTMAEAVAHLARGETVVTNSYHGTLWAMALGRRVLCVPFSEKFSGFRDPPAMAAPESWPEALAKAERRDILEEGRAANQAFYEKVMAL